MGVFGVLLLAVLSGPGPGEGADAPPVMVSRQEVEAVKARLMARVRANQTRVCERPVVGAPAIPGSGRDLLAAAIEGDGDEGPCAVRAEALKDALSTAAMAGWRVDPSTLPRAVREGLDACAGMNARVTEAVLHYDVCSPYQPGVRPTPRLLGFLRRGKLAILALRAAYDPAAPRQTLLPLLSWIRLTQDVFRGGGALLPAMIGTALLETDLIPTLDWILDAGDLDADTLRNLAGDLGDLLDAEPSVGPVIANDSDVMALQTVMPVLSGPDWVPPGGWEEGFGPVSERGTGGLLGASSAVGVATEAALLAVAFDEINRQQREACPAGATISECRTRLLDLAAVRGATVREQSMWRIGLRILASGDAVREIRTIIVDILASLAIPAFHKYIEHLAERRFLLACARIHALVLVARETGGGCPDRSGMTGDSWDRALEDPVFGGRMVLSRTGDGAYVVVPAGVFDGGNTLDPWRYEFSCVPGG
jgi:hypothetical protein